MNNSSAASGLLVCPQSKQKLVPMPLAEAETVFREPPVALRIAESAKDVASPPFGATENLLMRADGKLAYPVVDGVPILLAPEAVGRKQDRRRFDLADPRYAEAYLEMTFYNQVAGEEAQNIRAAESFRLIQPVLNASEFERQSFPGPRPVWLDATYDCAAQWDAYRHLGALQGQRVMQLGGKGIHAVKLLLGGAAEAWIVTPMLGEIRCAMALAEAAGVADRLRFAVSVGEELPFEGHAFDGIYCGGCLHHMQTEIALPEISRVLNTGGAFAAVEPWKAPLYTLGTTIFGKRERGAFCRPLTRQRIAPLKDTFADHAVIQHGSLTRYPLLALAKLGLSSSLETVWRLNRLDDALCSLLPGFRRMGSSVVCLGRKPAGTKHFSRAA